MKTRILLTAFALISISCEKRDAGLDSKIERLEKQAAEAIERQRQLEFELAEQKILTEREAIEQERTQIEQERLVMEELSELESAAAMAELERRQSELKERERMISETQRELADRQYQLTGLEADLGEREFDLAGREPIDALPPTQRNYVSGPTGDFSNFYEPLSSYGSWFQTTDYGYVYQPNVVRDQRWRPYTRGRWAFTDHGWTWVSNEPFGWACYHYGRWALVRDIGWVWVPGDQWAPAWVTWRESPGHIGWAPLPPETMGWNSRSWDSTVDVGFGIDSRWFSFISYNHFGNNIDSYCLPYTRNTVLYQSTTNVTHYVIRDRRVYCGGPRYQNVCERIGRKFPIHRLRFDQSPDFRRSGRLLSSRFSGSELRVVAPQMEADWNRALRPDRVSRDLGDIVMERPNNLPDDVRQQYRRQRQEEAQKATRWVSERGGREAFENERKTRLDENREAALTSDSSARLGRETSPEVRNSRQAEMGKMDLKRIKPESSGSKVVPTKPAMEPQAEPRPGVRLPDGMKRPGLNQTTDIPQSLPRRERVQEDKTESRSKEALRKSQDALREEHERSERERSERVSRIREEQQAELTRREELEAGRVLKNRNESEQQELLAKRQQELLRVQQEQQERVLRQQEETQRRMMEQQEKSRAEEVQRENQRQLQERARKQQEVLRAQKEQLERARRQQEDVQRRLQEEQQRQRAQQEQQERLRQQQDQHERSRRQQEDAQRRMQEQQERQRVQQEQQERMRQQQEQQERSRRQQEDLQQRSIRHQEQRERARQQQEEGQRMRQHPRR